MRIVISESARVWIFSVFCALSKNTYASCECGTASIEDQVARARYIFLGEATSGRTETVGEYKYYRLPGHLSWISGENLSSEDRLSSEVRVSKDRIILARFSDRRFYKGASESVDEMRMGDAACPMNVIIGSVYLIFSADGKTTGQ